MNSENAALGRLALSRECLRQALSEASPPQRQDANRSTAPRSATPTSSPAVQIALGAVRTLCAAHPLGHAVDAAARVGHAALRPVAQRHPLALVLGAALAGGLLASSRPWRWPFKPAIAAAWLPQLLMGLLAQAPARSGASAQQGAARDEARGPVAHSQ